jgi:Mn-dependent transcriptional regulator
MEKLTFSMENYLEAVYELSEGTHGARVSDVAARLHYSRPSASNAMNTLSEKGLVTGERYGEVFLTEEGRALAEFTAKKHQVIRRFFTEILHIDPTVADNDACAIEHVISNDSILAMWEYMNEIEGSPVNKG